MAVQRIQTYPQQMEFEQLGEGRNQTPVEVLSWVSHRDKSCTDRNIEHGGRTGDSFSGKLGLMN